MVKPADLALLTATISGAWGIVQGLMWTVAGKGFWPGFGWGFVEVLVILLVVFLAEPTLSALLRRMRH